MIVNIDPESASEDIPNCYMIKFDKYQVLTDRTVNVTNPTSRLGEFRLMFSYIDNMNLIQCRDVNAIHYRRISYSDETLTLNAARLISLRTITTLNLNVMILTNLGDMLSSLLHLQTLIVNRAVMPETIVHDALRVFVVSKCDGIVLRVSCSQLKVICAEVLEIDDCDLHYMSCQILRRSVVTKALSIETLSDITMNLLSTTTTHIVARVVRVDANVIPDYVKVVCGGMKGVDDEDVSTTILRHNLLMLL